MIKLTFEFETVEEASAFLVKYGTGTTYPAPVTGQIGAPKPKATKKTAAPKGVGIASIEIEPVVVAPEPVVVAPEPVVVAPEPVKAAPKLPNTPVQAVVEVNEAAVRAALREVFNKRGAAVATGILKDFGAAKISDVKPERYADFVKACAK